MRFLFSTGSLWSYSVERCFGLAAQAGFDGMEIMIDQRWDTRQATHLRKLEERYRLPIVAVHSPFWPHVPGWPQDQPGRIGASLELAEKLEATVVVHHLPARVGYILVRTRRRFFPVPLPWQSEKSYQIWLEESYATVQSRTDIALCIENMPAYRRLGRRWNLHHWNTPEEMVRFPSLTLDTTHLGTWGLEPAAVYPLLDGRVKHVHLSNFDGREHRRPESGRLQLDKLLAQMAAAGYEGAISLELYPEVLDAGEADVRIVERMTTTLDICRQWAAS